MKKSIYIILFLTTLSFTFSFVSCKKTSAIYLIEGTLTDETFNTPMANQTLEVSTLNAGTTSYLSHSTIKTDASGKYAVEIDRGKIDKIKLTGTKTNYFPIEIIVPISEITVGETATYNAATTAKAWVKLRFIHNSGDANMQMEYIRKDGKFGCFECCSAEAQTLTGFVDETVICINDGNTYYGYNYKIFGTSIFENRTTLTTAFDTAEIILNY